MPPIFISSILHLSYDGLGAGDTVEHTVKAPMVLSLTPEQLAEKATALLDRAADPATAAQARSYFKPGEKVSLYGIRARRLREIEKDLFNQVKGAWTVAEALRYCQLLVIQATLESKVLGCWLLSRFQAGFEKGLLQTVKQWLRDNHCENWAAVDTLCPAVVTPLIRAFPEVVPELKAWSRDRCLWVRRASAVSFVPLARKGEHLGAAYDVASSLFDDAEDLIHKATGWLLREAGKTDARRLEVFLLKHGPDIPRTTLRYSIERFPEEKRKMLLLSTRPRRPPRQRRGPEKDDDHG